MVSDIDPLLAQTLKDPKTWVEFCQHFHQDFDVGGVAFEANLQKLWRTLPIGQRTTIRAQLETLISSPLSDGELKRLWNKHNSDWRIGRSARKFYEELLTSLDLDDSRA
ncbi:hypothetical protein [Gimibacter soli]|uniref:Uncharacterized protein n=1 Tax=Gimibacter soli TaxID=3024400 RepID=A0AAF0BLU1_9PROT|nr:hypothetical protein [Gimibacter soli]WCL53536.1 hypothetical protein PH603_13435 [Gimibacter soli]